MLLKTRTHLITNFLKTFSRNRRKQESSISVTKKFSSESTNNATQTFNVGAGYTPEEKNTILEKINSSAVEELQKYSISEARLKKITAYRDKIGSFKTIDQVLLLQGIDIGVLDTFCKSIVRYQTASKNRGITNATANLLMPPLNEDIRIAIDTCTGIWVCGNLISWAQLDKSSNLLQWDCQSLEDVSMKDGLIAVVDSVASIVSKVPPSHAYIMESDPIIPFNRMNSKSYYLHLQRQQIVTTIASILGTRERRFGVHGICGSLINNIYMMRSRAPARLYNLLIGTEIVSARSVVQEMIKNREDNKAHTDIIVYADTDLKEYYESRDIYEREQMNWSLLLTTAFINLSVLKIASLKRTKGKSAGKKESEQKKTVKNCE